MPARPVVAAPINIKDDTFCRREYGSARDKVHSNREAIIRAGQTSALMAAPCQIAIAAIKAAINGTLQARVVLRLYADITFFDPAAADDFSDLRNRTGLRTGFSRRGLGGTLSFAFNLILGCRMILTFHRAASIAINFTSRGRDFINLVKEERVRLAL